MERFKWFGVDSDKMTFYDKNTDIDPSLLAENRIINDIIDPEYWLKICPLLTISDANLSSRSKDLSGVINNRAKLKKDGYFLVDSGYLFSAAGKQIIQLLKESILQLKRYHWHPTFILIFDEAYIVLNEITAIIKEFTGENIVPNYDFLAFVVESGERGFSAHRDRQPRENTTVSDGFTLTGIPKYITCWIALSDATPENGCMYVVPKPFDPGYENGDLDEVDPLLRVMNTPNGHQYITALPLPSASFMIFSHRLIHWSSANNTSADESPRISLSFAFSDPSFETPYLNPEASLIPNFVERLGLCCGQMISYYKRFNFPREMMVLFNRTFCLIASDLTGVIFDERYVKKVKSEYNWYEYTRKSAVTSSMPSRKKVVDDTGKGVDDSMLGFELFDKLENETNEVDVETEKERFEMLNDSLEMRTLFFTHLKEQFIEFVQDRVMNPIDDTAMKIIHDKIEETLNEMGQIEFANMLQNLNNEDLRLAIQKKFQDKLFELTEKLRKYRFDCNKNKSTDQLLKEAEESFFKVMFDESKKNPSSALNESAAVTNSSDYEEFISKLKQERLNSAKVEEAAKQSDFKVKGNGRDRSPTRLGIFSAFKREKVENCNKNQIEDTSTSLQYFSNDFSITKVNPTERSLIYQKMADTIEEKDKETSSSAFSRIRDVLLNDRSFASVRALIRRIVSGIFCISYSQGILPRIESPKIFAELAMIIIGIISKFDIEKSTAKDLEVLLNTAKKLNVRICEEDQNFLFAVQLFFEEFAYETLSKMVEDIEAVCNDNLSTNPLDLDLIFLKKVSPVSWCAMAQLFQIIQDAVPISLLVLALVNKLMTLNTLVESNVILYYSCSLLMAINQIVYAPRDHWLLNLQQQLNWFGDSWYAIFLLETAICRQKEFEEDEMVEFSSSAQIDISTLMNFWKKDYSASKWQPVERSLVESRSLNEKCLSNFEGDLVKTINDVEDAAKVIYNIGLSYPKYAILLAHKVHKEFSASKDKYMLTKGGVDVKLLPKQAVFRNFLVRNCSSCFEKKSVMPEYISRRVKLAVIRQISYLFLHRLISPGLLFEKVIPLLAEAENDSVDSFNIECLVTLLSICGKVLDTFFARSKMDALFGKLCTIRSMVTESLRLDIDRLTMVRQDGWKLNDEALYSL